MPPREGQEGRLSLSFSRAAAAAAAAASGHDQQRQLRRRPELREASAGPPQGEQVRQGVERGHDKQQEVVGEVEEARGRIAFYASTPMYRDTLTAEGLDDVAQELHRLSTTGGWSEMPKLITDEILDLFVVRAESGAAIAAEIHRRYDGLVERVNLHAGERSEPARLVTPQ